MNGPLETDDSNERRLVEAVAWRTHLTEIDAPSTESFEAWLASDSRNKAAWCQVQSSWDLFVPHAAAPELIEARQAALGRARRAGQTRWRGARLLGRRTAAAIAALGAIVAIGLVTWGVYQPDVYRTRLGERRVVTLSDGSRISLDSQSQVRVQYSEHARELRLVKGQVRFDVAHDVQRPFTVAAANQKIVATGTAFNVDMIGGEVLVTLIEGKVVVLDQRSPARTPQLPREPAIELRAGQQLVVPSIQLSMQPPQIDFVDIERTTAWESGRLVFEDEPLSSVAVRVSRYGSRALVMGDERAGALRISGVFDTGDVEGFVDTITRYLPLRAQRTQQDAIELFYRD